jgi:predicted RNase H-like HicB family nuclease
MAKSTPNVKISLSAIIYREDDTWLAHCLEMDIVAEGETPGKAWRDLDDLCKLQINIALEEGDLESIFRPAPSEIWKLFWLGELKDLPRKPFKPVNRFEARELEFA